MSATQSASPAEASLHEQVRLTFQDNSDAAGLITFADDGYSGRTGVVLAGEVELDLDSPRPLSLIALNGIRPKGGAETMLLVQETTSVNPVGFEAVVSSEGCFWLDDGLPKAGDEGAEFMEYLLRRTVWNANRSATVAQQLRCLTMVATRHALGDR